MRAIRNILALIGLLVVVVAGFGAARLWPSLSQFDQKSVGVYSEFAQKLLETQDPGVSMMWSKPVQEGLTPEEVVQSLKSLATQRNFLFVGESPFYKQVQAITGQPYRYINFLSFCDARVGMQMAEYRDAYTGFMPCRIALVEDKKGRLWLHSMNLDLMIHGGKTLPPELKASAMKVRDTILFMMEGAAAGEF